MIRNHRLSVLSKRIKCRNLRGLLMVEDQTPGFLNQAMLQRRPFTKISQQILPSTSACVHLQTSRRSCLRSDPFKQHDGLLSVGQLHVWHSWNGIQRGLYSTTPQQKEERDSDSKVREESAVPDRTEESETVRRLDAITENKASEDRQTSESEATSIAPGILKRFKNAYKEYGKALVAVHVATSSVWFGSFYYIVSSGVNIAGVLEKIGASEKIIDQLQSTGLGYAAVAYLMYKLATPARYTVTILGTQFAVKYLRKQGYMKPVPEGDSLKELWKDSRVEVKSRYEEQKEVVKDKVKEKVDDLREEMKDKAEEFRDEFKERIKDKATDFKDDVKDKLKGSKGDDKK